MQFKNITAGEKKTAEILEDKVKKIAKNTEVKKILKKIWIKIKNERINTFPKEIAVVSKRERKTKRTVGFCQSLKDNQKKIQILKPKESFSIKTE